MPSIDDQISKMVGRREGSEEYCIRIGLWDCNSCDRKQIWGPLKSCPSCGSSKDASEESLEYLPADALYYTEDQVAQMATGQADWICQYCGGLVSSKEQNCTNCSAAESNQTVSVIEYSSDAEIPSSNPKDHLRDKKIETNNAQSLFDDAEEESGTGGRKILFGFLGSVALFLLGIFMFWLFSSSEIKATVQNFSWKREIVVENYQTVIESGWSIPAGGRKISSSREIKSYKNLAGIRIRNGQILRPCLISEKMGGLNFIRSLSLQEIKSLR